MAATRSLKPDILTDVRWRVAVVVLAFFALLVRLLIAAHTRGGDDLRIYTYFGRLALHGNNPFAPPAGAPIPSTKSDNPPLEIAFFSGLLGLHDSPTTLRVVFALADTATILVVGLCFRRSRQWRAAFIVFYAFNPFVLVCWTGFAEDKTIVFLGIVVWLLALERARERVSWLAAIFVTAIKFVGALAFPVLALDSYRRRRWHALIPAAAFAICFGAGYLPWFPQSLHALTRRNNWLGVNPPIHASATILLARLGIYTPVEAELFTATALLAVFAWFAARASDTRTAVVWSLFAGTVFLPNNSFSRILLMTLPFIFLVRMTPSRWVTLWIISTVSAAAVVIATRGVPHVLSTIADPLQSLFAREATIRHALWVNLPLALMLVYYWSDRSRRATIAGHAAGDTRRCITAP
jgi:hypothetical protein